MKSPKGFRGKYFSLAAILALSTTITLANEVQSVASVQESVTTQEEFDEKEELTPSAEELDVVVVSKKIKVKESDATFASEIYTKSQIEKSKAKDIYEFLNTQTSVTTMPNIGNIFTQKIDIRGYGLSDGYQNVVINVNGRRLNSIDMVPQLLSTIPLDSIEKIEIIKSSGSIEYGDGANAGVINIITKGYDGASIKSYIGDNGLKFVSLGAGIKKEKFSLSGYIDDYSHSGYKVIAIDGTKDESWSRNKGLKGTLNPIENLAIGLEKTFSKMNLNYPNALTLSEYKASEYTIPQPSWGVDYSEQSFSSDVLSFWAEYDINEKLSLKLNANDEDKESNFITYGSVSKYENKSYSFTSSYKLENITFLLGADKFEGLRKTSTTNTEKNSLGYYFKADYTKDNHRLNFGARNEKVDYSYDKAAVSLKSNEKLKAFEFGYNYQINKKSSFFLNVSSSYQAPDIDRFFNAFTDTFNGFIEPMKVQTYSVGYNYFSYPNKLKLSLFYSDLKDEIYYNANTWTNTNLDKTRKYGLEVYDKYNIFYNLYTTFNYSYIDTEILEDSTNSGGIGREIPGVSKHNVKVAVGFNPTHRINLLLSHVYKSKTYAMSDFDGSFGKMEAYNSTDFSASYKYKNYEIFVKVNNLLDEKNALFADDGTSLGVYPVNYERNFVLGFNAKF